jgi:polyphenol oxidase
MMPLSPLHGTLISDGEFEIFFGNKEFSPLAEASQDPSLCVLHQVHGAECVEADTLKKTSADAHWTKDTKKQLLIKTADCLPIIVTSSKRRQIWAIHAGWRGVEQKITTQALHSSAPDTSMKVYIGPHIQQDSFAVDHDIAVRILSAHSLDLNKASALGIVFERENKFYIDLVALVFRELENLQIQSSHVSVSPVDTKTNPHYYSYRRGETGVRNYSLVRFCRN